jgi:selenide,water dikinase
LATSEMVKSAIDIMTESNAAAAKLADHNTASPMTDVTGFGLLRHARSLVDRFNPELGITISASALPLIDGAAELAKAGVASTMVADNAAAVSVKRQDNHAISDALLHDPQTGGGLLIIAASDHASSLLEGLKSANHHAAIIGKINHANDHLITITD